ncbi:MAG: hypothetical protein HYV28_17120 [Ignavibacteriales bacterium]|nr:hypothetical protein [Ignavibacteriales bacterium]
MKNILLFFLVVLSTPLSSQQVEILLSTDKNTYLKYESIYFLTTIKNQTSSPIDLSYILFDGNYRLVKNNIDTLELTSFFSGGKVKEIKIGEEFTSCRGLLFKYGNENCSEINYCETGALSPGKYKFYITGQLTDNSTAESSRPKQTNFNSNTVDFEIIEPTESIDLKALQELKRIYLNHSSFWIDRNKFENNLKELVQFIRDYPTSNYQILGYGNLLIYSGRDGYYHFTNEAIEMIEKFPASYYMFDMIYRWLPDASPEKRELYLNHLLKTSVGKHEVNRLKEFFEDPKQ